MIEILCTMTGIVAGVAIVASLMQGRSTRPQFVRQAPSGDAPPPAQMHELADQLRLLSFRMAADVSAHSQKVEAINDRLTEKEPDQPKQILSAINELISANHTMQGQLADARKRIAHQSEMIEEAAQLARTDALTGLANRRALNEFLQHCLNAIRPGECAGLLLLDIDHFKNFNDTYGHTTGDAVLAAFARNLKKWCNQSCYPARYGGEEFAVILTGRSPESIAQKAAELRGFISGQTISFEDLQLTITASGGLCLLAEGDSLQSAYDRSDEGLYNAKKAGRNCGYWLNDKAWELLPSAQLDAVKADSTTTSIADVMLNQASGPSHAISSEQSDLLSPRMRSDNGKTSDGFQGDDSNISIVEQLEKPGNEQFFGDILDLATFTSRISVYMDQLRKADLPATCILLKVMGVNEADSDEVKATWAAVQSLIQSQLRGIDVLCSYDVLTCCIFLPGCSIEAATERGSRIQSMLESTRDSWSASANPPERLALAVATAKVNEDSPMFLLRLESALAKAANAGVFEIAVHDGQRAVLEGTVPH